MKCINCGHELADDSMYCNKCGTKIENINSEQSVEETVVKENYHVQLDKKKKTSKKRWVIVSVILIILLIGAGITYYIIHTNNVKAAKLEEERLVQEKANYKLELNQVVIDMLLDVEVCSNLIDTYSYVWKQINDAKYGVYIIAKPNETIKISEKRTYASQSETYVSDANKGLALVYEKFLSEGSINELISSKESVENKLRELNNPFDDYKDAYEVAVSIFGLYTDYLSLAEFPSGNFISYNQKTSDIYHELLKKVDEFKVRLPND